MLTATGINLRHRNNIYHQVYTTIGALPIDWVNVDIPVNLLKYFGIVNTILCLCWSAIFIVKFSYLLFFRELIRNVRNMRPWWWTVLCVLVPAGFVCAFLPFYSCSTHDPAKVVPVCLPVAYTHSFIILRVQSALDIFTDLLLISIPLYLLYQVRITLARKLAAFFILGLSVFMIVISAIRLAFIQLPRDTSDAVWLHFWTNLEAAIAIMMVSLTAARSLFVQERRISRSARTRSDGMRWGRSYRPRAIGSILKSVWRSGPGGSSSGGGASSDDSIVMQKQFSVHIGDGYERRDDMENGFLRWQDEDRTLREKHHPPIVLPSRPTPALLKQAGTSDHSLDPMERWGTEGWGGEADRIRGTGSRSISIQTRGGRKDWHGSSGI